MDRRCMLCAGAALASAWPLWTRAAGAAGAVESFAPARLVDADGAPIKAASVGTEEALVFAYPYWGIPCFLINLGSKSAAAQALTAPDGAAYDSPAGAGPHGEFVAYVAICTHQFSYVRPEGSVLRYAAAGSALAGAPGRIVCCAHGSSFDPAAGGKNTGGPAEYPLLPVALAWNPADDSLSAIGTAGSAFLERFFKIYKADLIARFGPGKYRAAVGETTVAVPLSRYAETVSAC